VRSPHLRRRRIPCGVVARCDARPIQSLRGHMVPGCGEGRPPGDVGNGFGVGVKDGRETQALAEEAERGVPAQLADVRGAVSIARTGCAPAGLLHGVGIDYRRYGIANWWNVQVASKVDVPRFPMNAAVRGKRATWGGGAPGRQGAVQSSWLPAQAVPPSCFHRFPASGLAEGCVQVPRA